MRVTFANACNRPGFFDWHLGSLANGNAVAFECVYVGHVDLPSTLRSRWPFLRYFKAPERLSVAACSAWALTQGSGDLLYAATDDVEWDHGVLDELVATYDAADDYKLMVSPRYYLDEGGDTEEDYTPFLRLISNREDLPQLPLDGVISRRFYGELGGIDRRFKAVQHLVDVFARAAIAGGRTVFARGIVHERRRRYPAGYASICARTFYQHDRPLLENLWFPDGKPDLYPIGGGTPRLEAVQAYTEREFAEIGAMLVEQTGS